MAKYLKHDMSAIMPEFRKAATTGYFEGVPEKPFASLSEANKKEIVAALKAAGYGTGAALGDAISKTPQTARKRLSDIGQLTRDEFISLVRQMAFLETALQSLLRACGLKQELEEAQRTLALELPLDSEARPTDERLRSAFDKEQEIRAEAFETKKQLSELRHAQKLLRKYGHPNWQSLKQFHHADVDELFARTVVESLALIGENEKRVLAGMLAIMTKDKSLDPIEEALTFDPLQNALAYLSGNAEPNDDPLEMLIDIIIKDGSSDYSLAFDEYLGCI